MNLVYVHKASAKILIIFQMTYIFSAKIRENCKYTGKRAKIKVGTISDSDFF